MWWLAIAACLKPVPPSQAPTSAPVVVLAVLESFDNDAVEPVPETALAVITEQLELRNLQPTASGAAWDRIAGLRGTRARLEVVAEQGPAVLLVEAAPQFSAQVNGRYRWSVHTTVSIADAGDPNSATTEVFTVPVHLVYSHEREAEALEQASASIGRHVGRLVEDWIGAR